MMMRGLILQTICNYLGFESSASDSALVTACGVGLATHDATFVRFIIHEMLLDGGLRRNERGWLYQPRPASEAVKEDAMMVRFYVATDAAHMTVDALSEDDAARVFAESEGLRGVVDADSLRDVCEAAGGWASVEVAS